MQKKTILESIESSKIKINNYLNNEKVEAINDIDWYAFVCICLFI
jgi:hypothetical protein